MFSPNFRTYKLLAPLAVLAISTGLRAAEPKSDYICAVNEYISETQQDSKLIKSIPVTKNKEGDHHVATPVMTGEGTHQAGWSITLDNGLLVVNVRDTKGNELFSATGVADHPLGVKVPGIKAILSCNPSFPLLSNRVERLRADPTANGDSVTINPVANGAYNQILREFKKPKQETGTK